jgi:Putative glycosyl/glycerophosphate transferases involved in teichoic acid biosynthesis TagF/TagB/EpsJ/RodC
MPRRVAFIGWNPFQLLHVKPILTQMCEACFIIQKKQKYILEFSPELLSSTDIPFIVCETKNLPKLDGVFDLIICQTLFAGCHAFKKTKLGMIQYGYAKEPHNYGPWRALADVTLTYGHYASSKIEYCCPAIAVGNPNYDVTFSDTWLPDLKNKYPMLFNSERKRILYAPTWGELSSIDTYLDSILNLSERYEIILKLHHNTDILEKKRKSSIKSNAHIHTYGANISLIDLLGVCDILISDYSGAIFDGIFLQKPIVLLNPVSKKNILGKKLDEDSIEYARRKELGVEVNNPSQLDSVIEKICAPPSQEFLRHKEALRNELFIATPGATDRAITVIKRVLDGEYNHTQSQKYIRALVASELTFRDSLRSAQSKN